VLEPTFGQLVLDPEVELLAEGRRREAEDPAGGPGSAAAGAGG
jgi:hypothetical protein